MARVNLLAIAISIFMSSLAFAAPTVDVERVTEKKTVKVAVVCYDPSLASQDGAKLTEYMEWNAPRPMTENLIRYIREASGGYANYELVDWIDVDKFPQKRDGFRYTDESFLAMWKNRDLVHQPDAASYAAMFDDAKLTDRAKSGEIEEIWVWGAPYFGFDEYAMKIPGDLVPYQPNNPWFYRPYDIPDCGRTVAVMGFNYEVGEDNALHSFGHRCEGTLALTIGRGEWDAKNVNNPWSRFTRQAKEYPDDAQVGNVHGGPNATDGYDYSQPHEVLSSADDWINYPHLTGAKKLVSSATWGEPHHLNYQRWWLAHLPNNQGTTDGFSNSWWRYVVDYDATIRDLPPPNAKMEKAREAMY
jgi:hypothetical protein